jgi:hypothetical protein
MATTDVLTKGIDLTAVPWGRLSGQLVDFNRNIQLMDNDISVSAKTFMRCQDYAGS